VISTSSSLPGQPASKKRRTTATLTGTQAKTPVVAIGHGADYAPGQAMLLEWSKQHTRSAVVTDSDGLITHVKIGMTSTCKVLGFVDLGNVLFSKIDFRADHEHDGNTPATESMIRVDDGTGRGSDNLTPRLDNTANGVVHFESASLVPKPRGATPATFEQCAGNKLRVFLIRVNANGLPADFNQELSRCPNVFIRCEIGAAVLTGRSEKQIKDADVAVGGLPSIGRNGPSAAEALAKLQTAVDDYEVEKKSGHSYEPHGPNDYAGTMQNLKRIYGGELGTGTCTLVSSVVALGNKLQLCWDKERQPTGNPKTWYSMSTIQELVGKKPLYRKFQKANSMFEWDCIDAEILGTNAGIWLLQVKPMYWFNS
jgi:hypothetical protein